MTSFQTELMTGRLSGRDTRRYFSLFGWFAVVYFLVTTAVQTAAVVLVMVFFPHLYESWLFVEVLSFVPNYCIGLPLAYFLLLRRLPCGESEKRGMRMGDFFGAICVCMTLMTVGNYVSSVFMGVVESYLGSAPENPVETTVENMPLWATFLFVVVLAPILEELVFRGLICRRLSSIGDFWAIVLSSAFFALFHGNFYQVFYAFTLGCLFSVIYLKTGRLIYTVLLHAAVNFIGGFLTSWLLGKADIESAYSSLWELLSARDFSAVVKLLTDFPYLVAFLLLEAAIYLSAIGGFILLIVNRKRLKLSEGKLPPSEDSGFMLLTSAGIIVAIVVFSLVLASSVIPA